MVSGPATVTFGYIRGTSKPMGEPIDFEKELAEIKRRSGFRSLIGYKTIEWREGYGEILLRLEPKHMNIRMIPHGDSIWWSSTRRWVTQRPTAPIPAESAVVSPRRFKPTFWRLPRVDICAAVQLWSALKAASQPAGLKSSTRREPFATSPKAASCT